ncbi:MAG: TolC family protein, partial [Acidimicrobiia bacterium]|nr:TolC family protein [Acidimicrobiia bacterium]
TIGQTFGDLEKTFSVAGRVRIPIWNGGRSAGEVAQAWALAARRRAELDDLTDQVEGDVRKAYLDLSAAASQVDLAAQNVVVAREALELTRQRFDAGVADNLELVQAQEAVATAELDRINSVFAHNVSKLALARAVGQADERIEAFLELP